MKQLFLLLLLPLFSLSQALEPTDTYIISSGSAEGYDRPRVVITANNSPFIIWSKVTNPKSIKAKKWNGNTFGNSIDSGSTNHYFSFPQEASMIIIELFRNDTFEQV